MNKPSGYRCYECKAPLRAGWTCDKCGSSEAEDVPLDENPPMPKTSKEKQEDFRARQALLGLKEVRGIYLPEELHAKLKDYAASLLHSHKTKEQDK